MAEPFDLNTTYEDLMARKLANFSEMDRRETSPLYIATAANSAETAQMLATIKNNIDLVFADTAPREYLIRRAAERGLTPYPATKAKLKGEFNTDVPIGSRFNLDELNYVVVEKLGPGEFILECETYGNVGNLLLGTLIPIDYIEGLTHAELTEVLIQGEDEEDTEDFRKRYFDSFRSESFAGNRQSYKESVNEIPGVGGCRITRAWNGGGTVLVTIVDSNYTAASELLVSEVQEILDPLDNQGEGYGLAPIDHIVTVNTVTLQTVDVTCNLTFETGFDEQNVIDDIKTTIDNYFQSLGQLWVNSSDDASTTIVRLAQIEARIIGVNGVLDVSDVTLNGETSNIELDPYTLPVRGLVNGS